MLVVTLLPWLVGARRFLEQTMPTRTLSFYAGDQCSRARWLSGLAQGRRTKSKPASVRRNPQFIRTDEDRASSKIEVRGPGPALAAIA
jgi:hypothetical protein